MQFFNLTHSDRFVKKSKEKSDKLLMNKRVTQLLELQNAWRQGGGVFDPPSQLKTMEARDLK